LRTDSASIICNIPSFAREAAELRHRFRGRNAAGLDPYLNVIAAQTALLNDQQAVVNVRAQQMVPAVNLI
jgi:outer membrane protein TolC